jgi:hypothetical protein
MRSNSKEILARSREPLLWLDSRPPLVLTGAAVFAQTAPTGSSLNRTRYLPEYTESGELKLPKNFNEWVFVGSPLTPDALNGGTANFPKYHNVYIEPGSYEIYKKTGEFPERTIFFKELQLTLPAENPDGSHTDPSGRGFFPGPLNGADVTVKDSKRFADSGGWGYLTSITMSLRRRQQRRGPKRSARTVILLAPKRMTSGPNSIRCWTTDFGFGSGQPTQG